MEVEVHEALGEACRVVGDRWSMPVVGELLGGALRYGELQERLPGIAPNILSARLRKLEEEGLVVSARYSERPPRFEYRLTPEAAALGDAIRALAAWGAMRAHLSDARPEHAVCGTALEVRWWCPTCEVAVQPTDDEPILA